MIFIAEFQGRFVALKQNETQICPFHKLITKNFKNL